MADRVSASVTVQCTPELVYGLISDLPQMSRWSPESIGGRWLTGGGPVRGAWFVGRNRTGRRRWTTFSTVTIADRPHRFAFRVSAPWVPIASWEYVIESVHGGCRVEETWIDLRPASVRLISTLRTGVSDRGTFTKRSIDQTLALLKATAESNSAV